MVIRSCEDGEEGRDSRWCIELNLRVKSDGPLSWHAWQAWLIKVCFLGWFQRSLVGSH